MFKVEKKCDLRTFLHPINTATDAGDHRGCQAAAASATCALDLLRLSSTCLCTPLTRRVLFGNSLTGTVPTQLALLTRLSDLCAQPIRSLSPRSLQNILTATGADKLRGSKTAAAIPCCFLSFRLTLGSPVTVPVT